GQALAAAEEAILTGTTPPRAAAVRAARRDVRIGVRAIRNLGPPDDAYIADGLVEDLIDMLGRAGGLRVRSVGAEPALDLDVVVDGSLRRVGDDVRITVRALGAQDGFQIWGQRFDRRLDEILRVSDEVAREVAAALSATAAHAAAGRDVTTDRVVVELYLRARQLIEGGWWDDPRTLGFLKAALEHAPDSPVVLAAYAAQLGRRINAAEDEAARLVVEAEASVMARRAIAHGPDLGEPWVALAVVFYNHGHEVPAVKAARLALDRAPGLADASDVAGRILLELDPRVNDAVSLLERARWSNPRLPSNLIDLSRGYSLRGDWSLVDELMRVPGTESAAARAIAAARLALWRGGDMPAWPDRVVGFERINWSAYASMAVIRDGRFTAEVAAEWRRRLELMAPGRRARRFFAQLGCEVALRVEAHDVAWQMLDAAVDNGLIDLAWMDRMPLLAPLRDEPRFVAHRAVVAARATPPLEAWHAALPEPDPDAWLAEE
ncbi:MAG: hypothetical protein KC464_15920, partial [Myxococcales bacterium]|nr:hypothetical protein [Myxococcales bacterium]